MLDLETNLLRGVKWSFHAGEARGKREMRHGCDAMKGEFMFHMLKCNLGVGTSAAETLVNLADHGILGVVEHTTSNPQHTRHQQLI